MRRFLLLCITALLSFATFADEVDSTVQCFAVAYANSDEVDYFAINAKPIITYGDGTISVKQDGEGAYSIEDVYLNDVAECYFKDAVPTVATPEGIGKIGSGEALMTGLVEGSQVYVYTIDGQTIVSAIADKEGHTSVDLNTLKSGQVYILRTPKASYKIVK